MGGSREFFYLWSIFLGEVEAPASNIIYIKRTSLEPIRSYTKRCSLIYKILHTDTHKDKHLVILIYNIISFVLFKDSFTLLLIILYIFLGLNSCSHRNHQISSQQYLYPKVSFFFSSTLVGSGALSGKMLLVGIIENNKIDAYFRSG